MASCDAPSTACQFVRMCPSALYTKPDAEPSLPELRAFTLTIEGSIASTISGIERAVDSVGSTGPTSLRANGSPDSVDGRSATTAASATIDNVAPSTTAAILCLVPNLNVNQYALKSDAKIVSQLIISVLRASAFTKS